MERLCEICNNEKSRYTCPRCNINYCSLSCYRGSDHRKCSEIFYEECVVEELKNQKKQQLTRSEINDVLERLYDKHEKFLDSDDSSDNEEDLVERMKEVDLECPEAVWENLNTKEKKEFESLLKSGEISKLIPDWQPWWCLEESETENHAVYNIPKIHEVILPMSSILKRKPSEAVAFGLENIMFGYTSICQLFIQDWMLNAKPAVETICQISNNLSHGKVYQNNEEALKDAESTALRLNILSQKQCEQAKSDTQKIMKSKKFMLAAFSDLRNLFDIASDISTSSKRKYFPVTKKIDFYLSYIFEYGEYITS